MATLLHVSASPRGARRSPRDRPDVPRRVPRATPPDTSRGVGPLGRHAPAFGPAAAAAKMAVFAGAEPRAMRPDAWRAATETFRRFDAADYYLFSVPMWNAAVPYILKQFIDVVSQPGMIFGFDPERATAACCATKAAVIYTSAVYGPGPRPWLRRRLPAPLFDDWLRWAGIDDITGSSSGPTSPPPTPTPAAEPHMPRPATPARCSQREEGLPPRCCGGGGEASTPMLQESHVHVA